MLGLLAIKPWTSYELTQQMERSLGRIWPRTVSKLYEEPKKLVDHGLARTSSQQNGQRTRTIYTITPKGRRALAAWLQEPGDGTVIEFEQLVKVFFAENGTKTDTLNTLHAAQEWAQADAPKASPSARPTYAVKDPSPNVSPSSTGQSIHHRLLPARTRLGPLGRHHRRHLARRPPPSPPRTRCAGRNRRTSQNRNWRRPAVTASTEDPGNRPSPTSCAPAVQTSRRPPNTRRQGATFQEI